MKSRGNIYIYKKYENGERRRGVILRYRAGWGSGREIQSMSN